MIEVVRSKRGVALVDVVCRGITILKGQIVSVQLQYSKEWPYGGFRTVVGEGIGLGYTNHEAFYECFGDA